MELSPIPFFYRHCFIGGAGGAPPTDPMDDPLRLVPHGVLAQGLGVVPGAIPKGVNSPSLAQAPRYASTEGGGC